MGFSRRASALCIGCALILGGCVSSGTYQLKEQESRMLSKSLDESRSAHAELEKKFSQLQTEKADLGEKGQKLQATNGELNDRIGKLTADLAEAKSENDKLGAANGELSEKLRKLAVEFVEVKSDRDKVNLANLSLSSKVGRLSSEMSELKATNEKLATSLRPENLFKTLGENIESLQQKLDWLGAENARLKLTILEMRGAGRGKGASEPSRPNEAKSAAPATEGEKAAATKPVADRPEQKRAAEP